MEQVKDRMCVLEFSVYSDYTPVIDILINKFSIDIVFIVSSILSEIKHYANISRT